MKNPLSRFFKRKPKALGWNETFELSRGPLSWNPFKRRKQIIARKAIDRMIALIQEEAKKSNPWYSSMVREFDTPKTIVMPKFNPGAPSNYLGIPESEFGEPQSSHGSTYESGGYVPHVYIPLKRDAQIKMTYRYDNLPERNDPE